MLLDATQRQMVALELADHNASVHQAEKAGCLLVEKQEPGSNNKFLPCLL